MKKHRPAHIFENNQIYFLTGRTYGKIPHLAGDEAKNIFKNSLFEKTKKFGFKLYAWTIMDNHYHILIDENLDERGVNSATPSSNIPKFIGELHGATSFKIKKIPARQILNEEQIAYREQTPMEDRIEKRLEKIVFEWGRGLKPATPEKPEVADLLSAPGERARAKAR
jgi:REP element-mobilizing transposase RayT